MTKKDISFFIIIKNIIVDTNVPTIVKVKNSICFHNCIGILLFINCV